MHTYNYALLTIHVLLVMVPEIGLLWIKHIRIWVMMTKY